MIRIWWVRDTEFSRKILPLIKKNGTYNAPELKPRHIEKLAQADLRNLIGVPIWQYSLNLNR